MKLNTKQASEHLGVSQSHLYKWINLRVYAGLCFEKDKDGKWYTTKSKLNKAKLPSKKKMTKRLFIKVTDEQYEAAQQIPNISERVRRLIF